MSNNITGVLHLLAILIAAAVLYPIVCMLYNVFFHPLRKYPGPMIAAATPWHYCYFVLTGQQTAHDTALHEKYGEVVRIKPDELSIISESVWQDVYMHRQGQPQMEKRRRDVFLPPGVFNIITAPDDIHARQRRAVSHAFSEKALREQEPMIQNHVNMLMDYLRDTEQEDKSFNMVTPLMFTTFDVIADLAFGESFHALERKDTHPWIESFLSAIKPGCIMMELMEMPGVLPIFNLLVRPRIMKHMWQGDHVKHKIAARLEKGVGDRPDLMSFVLKNNAEGKGMSQKEILATFNVFMTAGAETTATLLSGAIYFLQKNQGALEKLKAEIRGAFSKDHDIDMIKTAQLPYLHAVLEESLRMYPPAPHGIMRITPPSGATIAGGYVPGNTVVGVHLATAFRSPTNFTDPLEFIPERWIETASPRFKNDKRGIVKPFSAGPRNCIGQNLAYAEMKLILSRIVFNFDLELIDNGDSWYDQLTYILWVKKPLMMKVKSVGRQ